MDLLEGDVGYFTRSRGKHFSTVGEFGVNFLGHFGERHFGDEFPFRGRRQLSDFFAIRIFGSIHDFTTALGICIVRGPCDLLRHRKTHCLIGN